jgi:hypothetical protein
MLPYNLPFSVKKGIITMQSKGAVQKCSDARRAVKHELQERSEPEFNS